MSTLNRLLAAAALTIAGAYATPLLADSPAAYGGGNHDAPNAVFTLRTGIAQGKMVFIGKGGAIDGKVNPTLSVHEGDVVQITLINGEGAEHDLVVPEMHVGTQRVTDPGPAARWRSALATSAVSPIFAICPATARRAWKA